MHIHILGVCGTFMAGIARLAVSLGHKVTGSDQHVYPPMSTQLEALGIELHTGYDEAGLSFKPELIIMGNAMKRGMPIVEWVLSEGLDYISGPDWLYQHILKNKRVLAVSGTHGKTTTSAMLVHILEHAGLEPSFLVGGVLPGFDLSARLTDSDCFVIEADEYDTAFFDKRPKFLHYRPEVCVINNLEFDHCDIYNNLAEIKMQFGYLLRSLSPKGLLLSPRHDENINDVINAGCWTERQTLGGDWQSQLVNDDGSQFKVILKGQAVAVVHWALLGEHNVANGLAAFAMAYHLDIEAKLIAQALTTFQNVKRRLECIGESAGVKVYDDFAHHPTAIATTLSGLRAHIGDKKIIACLELASHTMRSGLHGQALFEAVTTADHCLILASGNEELDNYLSQTATENTQLCSDVFEIVQQVVAHSEKGTEVVVMSNRSFNGLHQQLLQALEKKG